MSRTTMKGYVYRQYSTDGTFVADYRSSLEAAAETGISRNAIVRAAHGERKTGGGFIWKKVSETEPQEAIEISGESIIGYHDLRPVIQMDLEGNEIGEFVSIAQASRALGISRRSLSCALNGTQKTAAGFKWRLKEAEEKNGQEEQKA
ncbi:MAG TPA: hypothetical protein H9716_01850 [Candidatus Enterocloster faecavium]|uniref:Nuclease-associated modular DNA-binding 1 domain-containing protein n=1 Tax=Candidatus Enterocloster faecavium TaxID=2838560 RepID=A0A9D2RJC8_9FIRM|nr:hypothetical protein [Candidatus Enterocloster faecavium]